MRARSCRHVSVSMLNRKIGKTLTLSDSVHELRKVITFERENLNKISHSKPVDQTSLNFHSCTETERVSCLVAVSCRCGRAPRRELIGNLAAGGYQVDARTSASVDPRRRRKRPEGGGLSLRYADLECRHQMPGAVLSVLRVLGRRRRLWGRGS